jgi:ribosomal-protein-alanine N-acetyltransferase
MDTSSRPDLIECRLAATSDAPTLARMSRDYIEHGHQWSWTSERISRFIRAGNSVVLCAQDTHQSSRPDSCNKCRTAGFAVMEFGLEHAHLNLLAVQPIARRQGIAKALLNWLEQTAMIAGICTITLEVRAQNRGGRKFYSALNYQEIARLPRYYGSRETAYRLRKTLRARFKP